MYTNNACRSARCLAIVVVGFFCGEVAAKDHNVTVAIHVSSQGLDLSQPADAQTFYRRLRRAAWAACTSGNRIDLVPLDDPQACYETALGDAIRSLHLPVLTNLYFASHTREQAAACGIDVTLQAAAEK
jgi:UrcA family protein